MRLVFAGVAIGAMASLGLARYMQNLIYGVKPIDPPAIMKAIVLLSLVAGVTCYLPARRASRVDPAGQLHADS